MPAIEELEAWFHQACQLSDSEERLEFLRSRCGSDQALLQKIVDMVGADSRSNAFLDVATRVASGHVVSETEIDVGTRLGPFEIVRSIGRGGMGTVYEAVQKEPIERRVALKVIRSGFANSEFSESQFVRERQVLSRLQHPNITTILDAGIDSEGRLYFAMELLTGTSITAYCDEECLSITERAEVLERICDAIHHAHQRGILHLDIKPSNLMIQELDGSPIPKLIDFGIAETIDALEKQPSVARPSGVGGTSGTTDGRRRADLSTTLPDQQMIDSEQRGSLPIMGTPLYMSPEQMFRGRGDLDVRSDVYSLGAVLYELVVGTPPMDVEYRAGDTRDDALEHFRHGRLPTPAHRWTEYAREQAEEFARQRKTSAHAIGRVVNGEISAIIRKCLEADPNDRYESAASVARDLRAFRFNQPLDAIEPTLKYHGWKMFQRNRTLLSTIAGGTFLVVLSAIVASILAMTNYQLRTVADQRAERLASQSGQLASANDKLREALDRATKAESTMRAVADRERKNAAIVRAVNRYSLLMIDESRQSGFQIDTAANLPRFGSTIIRDGIPPANAQSSGEKTISIGGVGVTISDPSATVSTNVLPLTPGGSLSESVMSTESYLNLVVSAFGGSIEQLQRLVLNELRLEFGAQHPIFMGYDASVGAEASR